MNIIAITTWTTIAKYIQPENIVTDLEWFFGYLS